MGNACSNPVHTSEEADRRNSWRSHGDFKDEKCRQNFLLVARSGQGD